MPDEAAPPTGSAEFRAQRLKLAVKTSLASKATTALVTLGALPVAKHALGDNDFALYAVLMGCMVWVRIFTGGLGPALTINMASAVVAGDQTRETRLFVSGMLPKALMCLGILLGAVAYATWGSMDVLVGTKIAFDPATVRIGVGLLGIMIALQLWLSGFDAIQAGYQETHFGNIRQTIGNIMCLAAIFAVSKWSPTVVGLILAANAPLILAQLLNAFVMMRMRPHLRLKKIHFNREDFKSLSSDGLAYALSGGLASYLTLQFPTVFVGHQLPADQTTLVFISCQLVSQLFGMIQMIIVPLRPALSDAEARGDFGWIQRAFRKALTYALGYGLVVGVIMLGIGGFILTKLGSTTYPASLFFCGMFAVNFLLYCWENLHFSVLFSTRYRYAAAGLWLFRSVAAYGIMALVLPTQGPAGVFTALAISIVVLSAVPFAFLMRRAIYPTQAKEA
jgi:O-antigen/teichoic acid export membrane protein